MFRIALLIISSSFSLYSMNPEFKIPKVIDDAKAFLEELESFEKSIKNHQFSNITEIQSTYRPLVARIEMKQELLTKALTQEKNLSILAKKFDEHDKNIQELDGIVKLLDKKRQNYVVQLEWKGNYAINLAGHKDLTNSLRSDSIPHLKSKSKSSFKKIIGITAGTAAFILLIKYLSSQSKPATQK